jgi:hypothetical protein
MGIYALESPRALLAEMRPRRRGFSWHLVRLPRWGAETLCGAQWAGCQGFLAVLTQLFTGPTSFGLTERGLLSCVHPFFWASRLVARRIIHYEPVLRRIIENQQSLIDFMSDWRE